MHFPAEAKRLPSKCSELGKLISIDAMRLLRQDFEVSDELVVLCGQFVACLYNKPDVDGIMN